MIGLFVSLYWWWKMGRDEHWEEIALFDGFFLSFITFLIAGRAGYVLLHMSEVGTFYRILAFLAYPGLNVTVGIVSTMIFVFLFARSHGWHSWKVADAYVVTLSLILTIGGLGGLLNGSNPGRESTWGLLYPGETMAKIPVDVWILLWSIITFAIVSRVRKNFRFYSWYKGEASMAQDGLASLVFALFVGIYYLVLGFIGQVIWKVGIVPGQFLIGTLIIIASFILINRRVGRRDDSMWGKLKQAQINFMQWLRKRRR